MSAQPCGCDPEAKWNCQGYPQCTYGRWEAQDRMRQELARESVKLAGVDEHQPAPLTNNRPAIQDLVIADLHRKSVSLDRDPSIDDRSYARVIADIVARKEIGLKRYGTLLQAFNGRDALLDAYQEALDMCQYLRQVVEEGQTWIHVTYGNALRMTLHLRTMIEDRANEAGNVTALGDPARGD
jgi:hypothetical protein